MYYLTRRRLACVTEVIVIRQQRLRSSAEILVLGAQRIKELSEVSWEFPFILIGNSTLAFSRGQSWDLLNSWYTDRGPEHRLRLCLADFTNRSFIACATLARRRLAVECHTQLKATNISTIPKYTARFTPIPRSLIWTGKMVIYAIVTNYVYSEFWKRYHQMDHCEWNHCFFLFSSLFFFSP